MGYQVFGCSMGRCSQVCRVVAHLATWWQLLDFLTDCWTVETYR